MRMYFLCAILLLVMTTTSGMARHVFPFHYTGEMPDMVRMVDDPRQVGVDEAVFEPPRYGAKYRDLKTHDFYPHNSLSNGDSGSSADSDVLQSRVPQPTTSNADPANGLQPAPLPPVPSPPNRQIYFNTNVPQFLPGSVRLTPGQGTPTYTQLVFPQRQIQRTLQCFAVGVLRNEAMDAWCVANCNHTPSYCPPSHCACN